MDCISKGTYTLHYNGEYLKEADKGNVYGIYKNIQWQDLPGTDTQSRALVNKKPMTLIIMQLIYRYLYKPSKNALHRKMVQLRIVFNLWKKKVKKKKKRT